MVTLIEIFKADKTLILHTDEGQKTFVIGVGKNLDGPKIKRDDQRTPEGEYKIIVKNPRSQYHLSLGINYPNKADAQRGLEQAIIDEETYQAICTAHDTNGRIPWDSALGGEIYIHGDYETRTWSEGCIRMKKADIEEVYRLTDIGTKVVINP